MWTQLSKGSQLRALPLTCSACCQYIRQQGCSFQEYMPFTPRVVHLRYIHFSPEYIKKLLSLGCFFLNFFRTRTQVATDPSCLLRDCALILSKAASTRWEEQPRGRLACSVLIFCDFIMRLSKWRWILLGVILSMVSMSSQSMKEELLSSDLHLGGRLLAVREQKVLKDERRGLLRREVVLNMSIIKQIDNRAPHSPLPISVPLKLFLPPRLIFTQMPRRTKKQQVAQKKEEEPEAQEAKTEKPQPKGKPPKKFVKKTIEAMDRIARSKQQRIFLLSAERTEEEWVFRVLGASGSQYTVKTSTHVHCTCTDFRIKRKPCKHIFFIITQVAQNDECLDYFNSSNAHISKAAYKILDEQLTERLKSRMQGDGKKDPSEIDLKDDTNCVVCFTDMDKETEDLEDCPTCKKYFHQDCISQWKRHNTTCPLCRSQLAKTSADPLGQLSQIKIDC